MAGHSKHNGDQAKALLRDAKEILRSAQDDKRRAQNDKRAARAALDRAVALEDQVLGLRGLGLEKTPVPAPQSPIPSLGLPYGPASPVAQPPQDLPKDFVPDWARPVPSGAGVSVDGATAVYSVPGTPILSGFLTDVGEYNPDLQGRAGVQVYEQMRRGDGQVEATLQALTLPVLSAQWEVVAAEPRANSEFRIQNSELKTANTGAGRQTAAKAKAIADFVKENLFGGLEFRTSTGGWATQTWEEVVRNALLMLPFGCSVHEDVYTVDGGMLRLRLLADLLPITFYRFHVDEDGRTLLYLGQYGYRGARFEQVSVPADKITLFCFRREGANFWGRSVLRPAYPHWYVKNQLYRIDAIAAERNSLGVPVIILPPGFSKEDHDAAVNFVTQLAAHERTGVVLPNGASFEILGIKGTLKDLTPSIQHHNEQISMQALAMFMNLGRTATGSRSLGREHSKFFMLSLQNVANKIAEQITNTTIRRLVYYNFGTGAPCPRLVAANVQARALEDIVEALTQFAQAGLVVSDRGLRARIRQDLALPEETQEGIVTIKSETVEGKGGSPAPNPGEGITNRE
jgi:hypothetical protein